MNSEEKISIPKNIIIDLIAEIRVIDVALYRFSQAATIESVAAPDDAGKSFAALFAENRMGDRISSIRMSFVDWLINEGKIDESNLDEIDAICSSKLLKDFNIKY